MAYILGLLCNRIPIRDLVLTKLKQKFPEIKCKFTLPLLAIINALGLRAIVEIFVPNADFFLAKFMDYCDLEYFHALTVSYNIYKKLYKILFYN